MKNALEKEREKNKALEARLADYEERFNLIHRLSDKTMQDEVALDASKAQDDSDSDEASDAYSEAKGEDSRPSRLALVYSSGIGRYRRKCTRRGERDEERTAIQLRPEQTGDSDKKCP